MSCASAATLLLRRRPGDHLRRCGCRCGCACDASSVPCRLTWAGQTPTESLASRHLMTKEPSRPWFKSRHDVPAECYSCPFPCRASGIFVASFVSVHRAKSHVYGSIDIWSSMGTPQLPSSTPELGGRRLPSTAPSDLIQKIQSQAFLSRESTGDSWPTSSSAEPALHSTRDDLETVSRHSSSRL
ncbi:hypothetical protein IWX90DRAFT_112209 [Phyllosticta citrichinensis]|uniref:C2H2-type domain-containing protein n=1 Tax=Phyllosticta citrichinensis TaxID=1130410 RepID=A0ABR1Y373_9PEZI